MEFLLLATAHFLALLSPGPDFFLIAQVSLRLPIRSSLSLCFGIATANGVYLLFAILGHELLRQTAWLFLITKYLGAAYLLFLGVLLLRSPRQQLSSQSGKPSILRNPHPFQQYSIGLFSGLLNPKNAVFYLSLFAVMVSEHTSLTVRLFYAAWMVAVVLVWDCGLVLFLGQQRVQRHLGQAVYWIEKVAGVMLAIFGVILPFA